MEIWTKAFSCLCRGPPRSCACPLVWVSGDVMSHPPVWPHTVNLTGFTSTEEFRAYFLWAQVGLDKCTKVKANNLLIIISLDMKWKWVNGWRTDLSPSFNVSLNVTFLNINQQQYLNPTAYLLAKHEPKRNQMAECEGRSADTVKVLIHIGHSKS